MAARTTNDLSPTSAVARAALTEVMESTLRQVVDLAVRTIRGCDEASITLLDGEAV